MRAFKQLNSQDIIVSPLEVSKHFTVKTIPLTSSGGVYDVGKYSEAKYGDNPPRTGHYPNEFSIDSYLGKNTKYVQSGQDTGFFSVHNESSIYNSIRHLYYHNFISGGKDQDGVNTISDAILPYFRPDGVVTGSEYNTTYESYSQTDLLDNRKYPTGSDEYVGILSIPQGAYGDYIKPSSFKLQAPAYSGSGGGTITDDGEGRLILGDKVVGNIIYTHGIAVITNFGDLSGYGIDIYGTDVYGSIERDKLLSLNSLKSFVSGSEATASFSSSYTLYETQYKCTIGESEFNYSQNPTTLEDKNGNPQGFITGSYFAPYVTTVGLYNDNYELLAVGKLAKPLPTSAISDTTILVNIDRQ